MRKLSRKSGFTLLELLIVMSLIAMLAGVIVPATGSMIRSKGRRVTAEELSLLSDAVTDFYRDTRTFPSGALDLLGSSVAGWSGPYLYGTVDDPWSGQSGYAVDGFGNPYRFSASGLVCTLASDGPDRVSGTADDISVALNVTPILRELTLVELDAINTAIGQYNSVHLATSPLSGNYAAALSVLESQGFLPLGGGYETDEWGDAYVGEPLGASPMTAAASVNIGP